MTGLALNTYPTAKNVMEHKMIIGGMYPNRATY